MRIRNVSGTVQLLRAMRSQVLDGNQGVIRFLRELQHF